MFSSKTATFDRLLDKATSKLLLDPDWDSTLQICDSIRQGDVQPSYAVGAIRKKIENENPYVSKYALQVLESMVKNCGSIVHVEVATKDFMDFLKDQAKKRQDLVKGKIVELVQVWSHAFRKEESYKVVQETFNAMKNEGFVVPALKESDAMFVAEKAPEWRDGELCHRCRTAFTTFNRKHHCRACGQVFCQKCSSKTSIIPKYGIEKEVRVCDSCYDQIMKPSSSSSKKDELPSEYINSPLSKQSQSLQLPPSRTEAEIQEEEELQLALALSQSEAEAKEKQRAKQSVGYTLNSTTENLYSQPMKTTGPVAPQVIDTSDMGPELAHYLNRNYWQQKSFEMKNSSLTQPSAPSVSSSLSSSGTISAKNSPLPVKSEMDENQQPTENGSTSDEEREQFLKALSSSIEIFVNRMKSNSQRGRSIANDSSVQTLFMTLTAMHPTLMKYMQLQEDDRARYESLQDKLAQLKDARDALDVLREEHREKTRRQQEEMERLRQIQLAQKLEVLRQQKQVYLEYQRQMALQRMQEQEMEMRKRLEMQKQEQQIKAMQYGYPQAYSQTLPSGPYQAQPQGQAYAPVNQMQIPPSQQASYQVYAPGIGVVPQQLATATLPANQHQQHPGVGLSPQHQSHLYQQQQQQPAYQTLPPGIPQQGLPPSTVAGINTYMAYPPQLINNSVMMSAYQAGAIPVTVQDQQAPQQMAQAHQQGISLPAAGTSYMGGYYAPGLVTAQVPPHPNSSSEAELINFD